MIAFEYNLAVLISNLKKEKHKETITRWLEKKGVSFPDGGPVYINCNIAKNEPHLISIGKNTTLAGGVELVTHDNSVSKVVPGTTDLFGKITIGKNCFLGVKSVVLYGVTIADNVIIAAGSVVTRSILESNVVVAGNPARIISNWDSYKDKYTDFAWDLNTVSRSEMIERTSKGERVIKK